MEKFKITIAIILSITILSCNQKIENNNNKFIGLWSLDVMEQLNPETGKWSEYANKENGYPNGLKGYLIYDSSNHMAVHLFAKDYEKTDLIFLNALQNFDSVPNDMLQKLAKTIVYFSNYSFDEEKKIIEHAMISHINPNQWNQVVKRKYTIKGDTLILEPLEDLGAKLRLKWIKSK